MDILNPAELNRACRRFPQAKRWIERWRLIAEAAVWKSLVDVRVMFPPRTASQSAGDEIG